MSEVVAAGYIGVGASDLEAWRHFGSAGLGMQVGPASDDKQLLLRMDGRAWRVCVVPGPPGVAFMGWELPNATALAALIQRLRSSGVAVSEDTQLAKQRGVAGLARCEDPGGHKLEFFHGALVSDEPFVSPNGTRFVTGVGSDGDLGFGHFVVSYPDDTEAKRFYFDVLGFRLSDTAAIFGLWSFAHVNRRHHSLAIGAVPGPSALHHFMVEVADIDMVGRALDRLSKMSAEIPITLGRHTNDHMLSFYVRSPSGFEIEYGTSGRLIDDQNWIVSSYDKASFWGHESVTRARRDREMGRSTARAT